MKRTFTVTLVSAALLILTILSACGGSSNHHVASPTATPDPIIATLTATPSPATIIVPTPMPGVSLGKLPSWDGDSKTFLSEVLQIGLRDIRTKLQNIGDNNGANTVDVQPDVEAFVQSGCTGTVVIYCYTGKNTYYYDNLADVATQNAIYADFLVLKAMGNYLHYTFKGRYGSDAQNECGEGWIVGTLINAGDIDGTFRDAVRSYAGNLQAFNAGYSNTQGYSC